jgi:EAL domain-containing protein (putative c-di-GMP-specific phosphodiesterase class I)
MTDPAKRPSPLKEGRQAGPSDEPVDGHHAETRVVVIDDQDLSGGIERVLSERPDTVIMDYLSPADDGVAASKLLTTELPDLAVIMLTDSDRPGSQTVAVGSGWSACMRKTRSVGALLDTIHRVGAGEEVPAEENELPPLDELVVHYQPVIELVGHRVVGFEALVRWQHPRRGLLSPGRFLPLAEETGYVSDIGKHVTIQALADLATWQAIQRSGTALWVSVNMSAVGLSRPHISQRIAELLDSSGVSAESLVVEVTETALLQDTPEIAETLASFKRLGVKLALDDFGTAFSSLSYLRRFPFDFVKIDTSFVAELPHKPRAVLLAESVQQLASHMGAVGIAEGIERNDQEACLVGAGWSLGQGFLYSRGVPFDQASVIARRGAMS